jgi:UPF0716 protein FxsA
VFLIPFPILLMEIFVFVFVTQQLGFLTAVGIYFAPCVLGVLIMSIVGRLSLLELQKIVASGNEPGPRLIHSGVMFLSGLCFLVPSFSTRIVGVILLLPGTRHLLIWKFKKSLTGKLRQSSGFGFNRNSGTSGFRYYEFRGNARGFEEAHQEREVHEANILDVTPLSVTHESKKKTDNEEPN